MESKIKDISYENNLKAYKESLADYVGPIFIIGDVEEENAVILSATEPKENLVIINNKYPNWLQKLLNNKNYDKLLINNFEKISLEKQKLFIDIICKNYISSEPLPEYLKIIINSKTECSLIKEIREEVEVYKLIRSKK